VSVSSDCPFRQFPTHPAHASRIAAQCAIAQRWMSMEARWTGATEGTAKIDPQNLAVEGAADVTLPHSFTQD
jgi:hypothetical protein